MPDAPDQPNPGQPNLRPADHDGPDQATPAPTADVEGGIAAALADLPRLPVHEHPEVFEAAHDQLRSALRDTDPA